MWKSIQKARRPSTSVMGDGLSESDILAILLSPGVEEKAIIERAKEAKAKRPEWWAAMARECFKMKKDSHLLMPQALAVRVRTLGMLNTGGGTYWLNEKGTYEI